MREKALYISVVVVILVMLGVAVYLSRSLLDSELSSARPRPAQPPRTPDVAQTSVVSETIIDAGKQPEPRTEQQKEPSHPQPTAPVRPATIEQPGTELLADSRAPMPVATNTPGSIGEISSVTGKAYASDKENRRRMLSQKSPVFLNDKIETEAAAKIKITFADGTTISQGENAELVLDTYVYNPAKPSECGLVLRTIKGTCRIVTGFIVDLNPSRFQVKTKMASVGIRGCDLAFKTSADRDEIYLIDIGNQKSVSVSATKDGRQMMNMLTGEELTLAADKKQTMDIAEPMTLVSIVRGKGMEQKRVDMPEIRKITEETSALPAAAHNVIQKPDGAIFTLKPTPPVDKKRPSDGVPK